MQGMMNEKRHRPGTRPSREQGSVMIFVVLSFGALIGIAAWATETGRMWQAKNQLQASADAAALAGAGSLLTNNFQTVDQAAAKAAAVSYGPNHVVLGTALSIEEADVDAGSWDLATRTFTPLPGSNDPTLVRAVRVRTRRDDTANGPIPTILARAIGVNSVSVNTEAVALWGFGGTGGLAVVDLPIAIDCCAISGDTPGSACTQNYCDTISAEIPNECPLSYGGTATCLEFHSQPEQNACWTTFNGDSPSINTPDLIDTVEAGNTHEINGPIYLDNGDKVPVVQAINDRFEAEGEDLNLDGNVDSWVVVLPVMECQNPGDGCSSGDPQTVVGFICFDIHEVLVTPEKIIKGSFLCTSDPRCEAPGLGPGGTVPGALSAVYPVLVD